MYSKYDVLTCGTVISRSTGKPMKPWVNPKGYNFLRLSLDDGTKKTLLVHRVVASLHIPNPDNLPEVNHIDGNKSNNAVDNLEWCDRAHNIRHAVSTGLYGKISGSSNYRSKTTTEMVAKMRKLHESGLDCAAIGRAFGVSQASAYRICHNQSHKS